MTTAYTAGIAQRGKI